MKQENWELVEAGNNLPITTDISTLTYMELKLLIASLDPEMMTMTVKEKCERVGCSRDTWYSAMKKPAFQDARNQLAVYTIKENNAVLVQAGLKHALAGSFQHWKELMILGGIIQPSVVAGEAGEITIRFVDPRAKAIDVTQE